MASFYAKYPAESPSSTSIQTVQGEGTPGAQVGGLLTIQGDPAGTPIPISGTITAASASVGPTGAAVPADADFIGYSVAGTLTGATGTANGLKVDGSAVTQPVSGTVAVSNFPATQPVSGTVAVSNFPATQPVSGTVAATQSGTWTVQPGNTANTTPWLATIAQGGNSATVSAGGALKVDASGATQPVSGTVTANQGGAPWSVTGSGTAGTAASGVVTIQGIASMTAVKVDGSGVTQPISGTVTVGTLAPQTTTTAAFQAEGSLAFGSVTGSFQTVFTPSAATKILQMRNNTNASISVSFDAGTTTNYVLDAGDQVSLDLQSNALVMSTTAIQIKQTSGAPTSGSFRVNGGH